MFKLTIAVLTSLLFSTTALAATITFTGATDNDWHKNSNWSSNSVPTAADRAVIPSSLTAEISQDTTVDTLSCSGTIRIQPAFTLTLQNNNDNATPNPDHSQIDGEIRLEYNSSTLDGGNLAFTTADHILHGSGTVIGDNEVCEIRIDDGRKLTNQLATTNKGIRKFLTVTATGEDPIVTFRNEGLVEVTEAKTGQMILTSNVELEDIATAIWSVNACNGTLVFQNESLALGGHFFIGTTFSPAGGKFKFDETVWTCGTYTRNGGGLIIASGKTFNYGGFAGGSGPCPNPGSLASNPPTCSRPYSATGTHTQCASCPAD
ncbi:MAG: hypothetical protein ACKVW3_06750 [Phycisphaerales bacterium]